MKVLVVNAGSSTLRYRLFDAAGRRVLAGGKAERLGEAGSGLVHRDHRAGQDRETFVPGPFRDHRQALRAALERLAPERVDAVGHRVVHGGEGFAAPALVDEGVLAAIQGCARLAPLHNPANLAAIEVAREAFPGVPHVAVFDTAFHQSLPEEAFRYAVPAGLYEQDGVRRYGFHGTSHAAAVDGAAALLGRPAAELDLITLHLGSGASAAAVARGRSVDTTMGFTPLEGLVMGTRCGDLDPAVALLLAERVGAEEARRMLAGESGLKGLCGDSDMREVLAREAAGDAAAALALAVYARRVRKSIGAFLAVLGRADALVFTAGVGENSPEVRERCCRGLEGLGVAIDPGRNRAPGEGARDVGRPGSAVRVLVVPADEELRIAEETWALVSGSAG